MSSPEIVDRTNEPLTSDAIRDAGSQEPKYKSWRKKYRKMKIHFDDGMEEANSLFLGNNKLQRIAQRLQEENDQLMEILLDINNDSRRLANKHYNITSPSLRSRVPELTPDDSLSGQPSTSEVSLSKLESEVTHTALNLPSPSILPTDLQESDLGLPGYLTPTHEDEYLSVMDSALDALPLPSIEPHQASNGNAVLDPIVDIRPRHWDLPTAEDFAQTNPVSVHNWLGRHQPQIAAEKERLRLLDKGDKDSERGAKSPVPGVMGTPATLTGTKRKAKDKIKKEDLPFEGLDDEIGFDPAEEAAYGSSKKRKNDDDAYRPKGGRSKSGGSKRKRDRESIGGEGDVSSAKKMKKAVVELVE